MTISELKLMLTEESASQEENDEFTIPLDISDIISICREYNKLGYQIQNQVEIILEFGVDDAIKTGQVKRESLPHIEDFLNQIVKNAYFGDATSQASDVIDMIKDYQFANKAKKIILN